MAHTERESDPYATPLIGALLRMPWERIQERLFAELSARGFSDLSRSHLGLLVYPGPAALRPSELARRTRMSKQALHYLLGEMERLGYLARAPHPDDRRSKIIAMTPRGEAVVQLMRDIIGDVEREWAAAMGPERFDQLCALLVELNEHADTAAHLAEPAVSA